MTVQDEVGIITDAARGIGQATAVKFAQLADMINGAVIEVSGGLTL
jgi:NAD(P)-dependent dehydrogenase (short-subunit alcohol dehydrogenase family)